VAVLEEATSMAEQKETVLMSKIALRIVRIACLIVVACFFFGYFVISCQGAEISISGMEAAFGIDKKHIPLDPSPLLLLIPVVALVVLIALSVPPVREKLKAADLPPTKLSIAGSVTGLLLLAIAHYAAIGKVEKEFGDIDISSVYHTGFGFKISVLAYIAMFVTPFAGKMLNKNAPSQNNAPPVSLREDIGKEALAETRPFDTGN
jgi:hypothetical protein